MQIVAYHSCSNVRLPDYLVSGPKFGKHGGSMLGSGLYANLDESQVRRGNYGRILFKILIDIDVNDVIAVTHRGFKMKYNEDCDDLLREQYLRSGRPILKEFPRSGFNRGGSELAKMWYRQFISDGFKLLIYYGFSDSHSIVCWDSAKIKVVGWSHTSLPEGRWEDVGDFSLVRNYYNSLVGDYCKKCMEIGEKCSSNNSKEVISNRIAESDIPRNVVRISKTRKWTTLNGLQIKSSGTSKFVVDHSLDSLIVNQNNCFGVVDGAIVKNLYFRSSRVTSSKVVPLVDSAENIYIDYAALCDLMTFPFVYKNCKQIVVSMCCVNKLRGAGLYREIFKVLKDVSYKNGKVDEGNLPSLIEKFFPNAHYTCS